MPKVAVYNMAGAQVGEMELSDSVFGIEPNEAVVHQVVKAQLANRRVGTASTKTRGMVRGGGRKPWRQKGTGRARVGSRRSPIWRGGGTVFGPHPRDYSIRIPKKVRRLALKSVLSDKLNNGEIVVLEALSFEEPKTKRIIEVLNALNVFEKALVVTADGDINVTKSARNIPGVKPVRADFINVYDLLAYDKLVITKDAVAKMEEVYG
ncbi:MAG: 50S ribosomal protein L4 [Syntrophomonadaceae bacterium]|jgi:large subunit ribosomal protein L4|nr:50S ribosomal protein L4 [Syntrophomonadaceae bacterium]